VSSGSPSSGPTAQLPPHVQQPQSQYRHAPVPAAPPTPEATPAATASPSSTQAFPSGPQVPQRQPVYSVPPSQYGYAPQHQPQQAYAPAPSPQYSPGPAPQQAYASAPPAPAGPPTTQNPALARRRKLSPGWIAFIALDAILIVAVVVFAFNALREPVPQISVTDDPVAAAPSQDAAPEEDGADANGELVDAFASPSRNITCEIFENAVTCGIAELDQQPAPVESCEGSSGYAVSLDGDGKVSMPCLDQADKPKKAPKDAKQVAYGESVTEGDFTCESRQDGVRCTHDPSGNGFSLARAGIGTGG
jgi:hypothetical protein